MEEGMTNAELKLLLETLADLLESKAKTPEEAVQILRAKAKAL